MHAVLTTTFFDSLRTMDVYFNRARNRTRPLHDVGGTNTHILSARTVASEF